jgi:hypothetical protein
MALSEDPLLGRTGNPVLGLSHVPISGAYQANQADTKNIERNKVLATMLAGGNPNLIGYAAASGDPNLLRTVLNTQQQHQWQSGEAGPMTKIGVDKYGNDVYAPYNQYTGKIGQMYDARGNPIGGTATPSGNQVVGGGGSTGAPAVGAPPGNPTGPTTGVAVPAPSVPSMPGTVGGRNTSQLDPSLYGEDFIKQAVAGNYMDENDARVVRAIAQGQRPALPQGGRTAAYNRTIMEWVQQYDPSYSADRFAVRQDFDKGKAADAMKSLNQVMEHLDALNTTIDKMGNFNFLPALNGPAKFVERQLHMGNVQTNLSTFETEKDAVAEELMKVFRNSGGSLAEVQQWKDILKNTNSTDELKAAVEAAIGLINSRMDALGNQWRAAMGKDRELLTPENKAIFERLQRGQSAPTGAAPAAPTPTVPAGSMPGDVRVIAPITRTINGKTYTFDGANWTEQ